MTTFDPGFNTPLRGSHIIRMARLVQQLGLWDYFFGSKRLLNDTDNSLHKLRFVLEAPNDDVVYFENTCLYTRNRGRALVNMTEYPALPTEIQQAIHNAVYSPDRQPQLGCVLTNVPAGTNAEGLTKLAYQALCRAHGVAPGTAFAARGGAPLQPVEIDVTKAGMTIRPKADRPGPQG